MSFRLNRPCRIAWFVATAWLTVLTAPSCAHAQETEQGFSVLSWNLEWFFDDIAADAHSKLGKEKSSPDRESWDWRRDAVAQSIAKANPTVVAMQEVENRRVLFYLNRALDRNHKLKYRELFIEGDDYFTQQDVGMMYRAPADPLLTTRLFQTQRMRATNRFWNVTKHLMAVFEVPVGDRFERVTVMNVHLRARKEAEDKRQRQARLIHHWLADPIRSGEHVIVLGDLNTEEDGGETRPDSEVGVLCGLETDDPDDDLYDLHTKLPADQRRTHLLPGRQFDRILVSRSLLDDDPERKDLAFGSISVLRDLNVQGELDSQSDHWDRYWELPDDERDISDHLPLMAEFEVK